MGSNVQTLQVAQPAIGTVSRQPQTTTAPSVSTNVPFNRLSRKMQIPGPSEAGMAYGGLWTPILKPVGGYLRNLPLYVTASGGAGGSAVLSADGPYNVIQNLILRDPYGQPIIQCDGYSLNLIDLYGGQVGALGFGNQISSLPSWDAVDANGDYRVKFTVPFELDSSGYGSLASMNASSQPQLQVQLNASGVVYDTPPAGTVPTLTLQTQERFWAAPVDHPEIAPPDVGSSGQWSVTRAQSLVQSASYQRIVLPRVGTWIHTLILVLRDSTGARIEAWPDGDLTLWADGVPIMQERLLDRRDDMFTQFGVTAPTGVIVYSYRDSVQQFVSTADTYDNLLPTTPATLLEISGTFGTISNAPASIQVITGELFPVGGIPYNHLAG